MLLAALLTASATNTRADGLEGTWKGLWIKGNDPLPVTVNFQKLGAGYSGSFDSDPLQVTAIPFSSVEATNGKVQFLLKSDDSTSVFDGWIKGGAISGTFTDGHENGTFKLTRAALPPGKMVTRDVFFQNGQVTLAGTLLLPATRELHTAVIFLQGSGPEGRWANRYLAQKLAERGIAALIYDKRGVGKSTGNWKTAGFDALADDAAAGIRFLRSQPGIATEHIGVYGHSQGATITPLVATRAPVQFVIASAASGISPAECEIYSVENSVRVSRLPLTEREDAQNYVRKLVDVAYHDIDRKAFDVMAERFKGRSWYFPPPPPDNSFWTIARLTAGFRPAEYWRQVHAPVLLIYGAHDERVPPAQSADIIQAALAKAGNTQVSLRIFANADHTFAIVTPPHQTGWSRHVPEYADTLTNWILGLK